MFCHTPHAATITGKAPLWNRAANAQTYTRYTSSSLDANTITDGFSAQPGGSSLLCLSCHDGMIALGNVNVLPRNTGTSAGGPIAGLTGKMPFGSGTDANSGFTRNLGTDLSNDHPISITYNDALATADGEMAQPSSNTTLMGIRSSGYKPLLPLEPTGTGGLGQVQCATCHDPHITKEKFLRLNRFQTAAPTATFSQANDQICLACHRKLGTAWSQSAHANTTSAAYVYKDDASLVRGFANGKKVWEVACLNCHDTHTASGSRRLLREGTGATPSATSAAFQLGSTIRPLDTVSSIENTCYQCHNAGSDTTGATILKGSTLTATTGVPDIFTEFGRTVRMPIKTIDQNSDPSTTINTNITEIHDITDANFTETQLKLGRGNTMNRHVECTDCHNPHQVIKNALFNGLGATDRRTHVPAATTATGLTGSGGNIASGALRGAWGVEPSYTAAGQTTVTVSGTGSGVTGTIWPENPTFRVVKGDPGSNTSTARTESYLTREYQLCFKCHSNYANGDTAASFPVLGNTGGGTFSGTNGMTRYTNVAAEFAARATDPPTSGNDQGELTNTSTTCGGGDCIPAGSYPRGVGSATVNEVNHRSWHPVVFPTGRSGDERGSATFANIKTPFATAANIGKQTMQCSDCHGQGTSWTDGTGPNLGQAQGPHGSTNNFLLKGTWSSATALNAVGIAGSLCENCHVITGATESGLEGNHVPDGNMAGAKCMRCHIAVPHGWKNKAFLVNKRCVGKEGGEATDCVSRVGFLTNLDAYPYYVGARNSFLQWRRSRDAQYNVEDSTCNNVTGGSGNMKDCAL